MPMHFSQQSGDHGTDPAVNGGMTASRRIVLKAIAGVAALTASGVGMVPAVEVGNTATAQWAGGTRARRFVPTEKGIAAADAARGRWVTFQADYPFWALGASWNGRTGLWPIVAIQLSEDGVTWSEAIDLAADTEDGGRPSRDGRLFTPLVFTNGAQWVRYQTVDRERIAGEVADLSFVYIDPTDGPWAEDIAPTASLSRLGTLADTVAPPEIVTRAEWGANESWRFDSSGEIWPPEYETVSHLIVHHTATANRPVDVPGAIRSIYYYHAVERGWGDIGYNYLVDHNGRIYQGRYGGQNVIGGHSFQFAFGSSGISVIGNFTATAVPEAAKAALVSICAWVGRDLDPLGASDFHEVPNLPVITSHRDVNSTTCPGDLLWNQLPTIRQLVAQTLAGGVLETGLPAGIVPGDRVRVQTDDGTALNLRSAANGTVTGSLADGALAWVIDGPETLASGNWYRLQAVSGGATGWATAQFLIVDPPLPPGSPTADYPFGLNIRFVQAANLRLGPSTTAGIVANVPRDTWAFVMAGPTLSSDGRGWYQVRVYQIGDGWVDRELIAPAPINESPAAAFRVGDTVEAIGTLNLRPRPGIAQGVIATAPAGSQFTVTQAPIEVTGAIWYGVYSATLGGGWISETTVRLAGSPPPAGKFQVNDTFRVSASTNLRATPTTTGSVLTTMAIGTTGTVVGGPGNANGYTWWQVQLATGTTGWCIENWLVKTTGGTVPPPSAKFAVNDTFRVTQSTNLRPSAGTTASVVQTMPAGTTGTVIGGPTTASGYTWWNVRLASGTVGWCIETWLVKSTTLPPPPPTSTKFQLGDAVRVSSGVNLRASPGTSGSIVRVLPAGTTGTVIGGPTAANGYTWWNIQTPLGTGWAVETWLEKTAAPPPSEGLPAGTTVRVTTANLRLRSAASTSGTVLALLPSGHLLTVVSGPTSGSGYAWYRVTSATYGSGYVVADFIAAV
jgi:uncharacterized protein YgiM (DUF1202 family)